MYIYKKNKVNPIYLLENSDFSASFIVVLVNIIISIAVVVV